MSGELYFTAAELEKFATSLFAAAGLPPTDANVIAADLVKADLRGVESHGVSRVPMYLDRLRKGLVNPRPALVVEKVAGAVARLDGDNGMGFLASHRAIEVGMDLARDSGIGLVGVNRSTHFGMAALYALQAAEAGYIGMVFTNSSPAIPIWGGSTAFLGASPLAAGVPAGKYPPYVMDMAMTVIARGKIRLAAVKGEAIPEGLALDSEGRPTTDAAKAFEGVCLPFGGVKGSVLATLMDLLAGVFTGANYAGEVKSLYFDDSAPQNVGHLFFVMRPDLFMSLTGFEARMEHFVDTVATLPRAAGVEEILIPGEPERRREVLRRRTGVPVATNVAAELAAEGARVAIAFPTGRTGPLPG